MNIYVASSWKNTAQPTVVARLRELGHQPYDFRNPEPNNTGFSWSQINPRWKEEGVTPAEYLQLLAHPVAEEGFRLDMHALTSAEACVMVMPCGLSAGIELGWAVGAGLPTAVYVPGMRDPDLMVKMTQLVTDRWDDIENWLSRLTSPIRAMQRVRDLLTAPGNPPPTENVYRIESLSDVPSDPLALDRAVVQQVTRALMEQEENRVKALIRSKTCPSCGGVGGGENQMGAVPWICTLCLGTGVWQGPPLEAGVEGIREWMRERGLPLVDRFFCAHDFSVLDAPNKRWMCSRGCGEYVTEEEVQNAKRER